MKEMKGSVGRWQGDGREMEGEFPDLTRLLGCKLAFRVSPYVLLLLCGI